MLPSLLLLKEVVISKVLAHSITKHRVFRSIYRLSHSFPISGSKSWFENGEISLPWSNYKFFFIRCSSWKLHIFPAQPCSSTQKDTSTHTKKLNWSWRSCTFGLLLLLFHLLNKSVDFISFFTEIEKWEAQNTCSTIHIIMIRRWAPTTSLAAGANQELEDFLGSVI